MHTHESLPLELVANAGYGSEENYVLLEELNIRAYVKYNYFDKDRRKKKEQLWNNIYYNKKEACCYCPRDERISCIGTRERKTEHGYLQE